MRRTHRTCVTPLACVCCIGLHHYYTLWSSTASPFVCFIQQLPSAVATMLVGSSNSRCPATGSWLLAQLQTQHCETHLPAFLLCKATTLSHLCLTQHSTAWLAAAGAQFCLWGACVCVPTGGLALTRSSWIAVAVDRPIYSSCQCDTGCTAVATKYACGGACALACLAVSTCIA